MGLSTYKILKTAQAKNRVEVKGELLKRTQDVLFEILTDFADVCEKYGFYYSLCGGSALGAVRHKGFIPWDDDIDVFMVRSEYERFLDIFENELGEKYNLHSLETTPELGMPITQMMKKGTMLRTYDSPGEENGVNIDIFVLENVPDSALLRFFHGAGSMMLGFCLSCARFRQNEQRLLDIFEGAEDTVIKAIRKKAFIGKLMSFRKLEVWAASFQKWNSMCKNSQSKYVVCPTGIKHYFNEIFLREEYCSTTRLPFETAELKIISSYDKALTRMYGDYMQEPPPEKRETHFVLEIRL